MKNSLFLYISDVGPLIFIEMNSDCLAGVKSIWCFFAFWMKSESLMCRCFCVRWMKVCSHRFGPSRRICLDLYFCLMSFAGRENHVWAGTVPQLLHQQPQILLHLIRRRCKCANLCHCRKTITSTQSGVSDHVLLGLTRCDNHWLCFMDGEIFTWVSALSLSSFTAARFTHRW